MELTNYRRQPQEADAGSGRWRRRADDFDEDSVSEPGWLEKACRRGAPDYLDEVEQSEVRS